MSACVQWEIKKLKKPFIKTCAPTGKFEKINVDCCMLLFSRISRDFRLHGFFFEGLEFPILEFYRRIGSFWAGSYGELGGLFLLGGAVVGFRLLTAAGY